MADIDLVVTDLDGTLWHGHEEVHTGTVDAWRELERRGTRVMVATGRRLASTRDPLARLGLAPTAAVLNGAMIVDLHSGQRRFRHVYATDDAHAVLSAFHDHDLEPCIYVDHATFDAFHGPEPSTHPGHLAALGSTASFADTSTIVANEPVLMFGIIGSRPDRLAAVAAAVRDVAEPHVSPDQWGGHTITVTPRGLSKWVGVVEYCRQVDIDPGRVLAIGDGPNDLELLSAAAVAVVPSNGCAEALALADHVVPSPLEGGWATLLDLV
jgi:Cof subfamily protein (haloacid dehalogenase superfamily)